MELLHEYVFTKDGLKIYPSQADYNIDYFDSRGNKLLFKAKDSKYKVPHFSYYPDVDSLVRTESNTVHTEAIEYIQQLGYFEIGNLRFEPKRIVVEKATINGSRLIPDITFYGDDDETLCLIEVVCTHKCEAEKIKTLTDKNILTYELYYEDDYKKYTHFIHFGYKSKGERIESIRESTKEVEESIKKIRNSITIFEKKILIETDRIQSITEHIRDKKGLFNSGVYFIDDKRIRNITDNIEEEKERIKRFKAEIQSVISSYWTLKSYNGIHIIESDYSIKNITFEMHGDKYRFSGAKTNGRLQYTIDTIIRLNDRKIFSIERSYLYHKTR